MKFLCLPGGFCNAKMVTFGRQQTMAAQLEPFISQLDVNDSNSFIYAEGSHLVEVPAEFTGFFGPPPNYAFVKEDTGLVVSAIRNFNPQDDSPEKILRALQDSSGWRRADGLDAVLDRLITLMDDDGAIEGLIGYSEGAGIASALLLEEKCRARSSGRMPCIKCAIFMAGVPPSDPVSGRFVLQDEAGQPITIPTCHVVGTQDTMITAAMALYNLCDPDTADLFDHGGGHLIPRDRQTLRELVETVQQMMAGVPRER